jgi:hypothetical protein
MQELCKRKKEQGNVLKHKERNKNLTTKQTGKIE